MIAKDLLFGLAVGDALGVPVEFQSREKLSIKPVTEMIGYGTHHQPPGTWSDDSSLAFLLAEGLIKNFSTKLLAEKFVSWFQSGYWTPHGKVFDIGISTREAIGRLQKGIEPELAGGIDVSDNGNGSLMRILPLILFIKDKPLNERYNWTKSVSSLTHAHVRSVIACFYYLELAQALLTKEPPEAYTATNNTVARFLNELKITDSEINVFNRLLNGNIHRLAIEDIKSSGYVIHTLEAAVWCFLTSKNYSDTVLKAVNLGEDTDTTGAVAGGFAGLYYGFNSIPEKWISILVRKDDINQLALQLSDRY